MMIHSADAARSIHKHRDGNAAAWRATATIATFMTGFLAAGAHAQESPAASVSADWRRGGEADASWRRQWRRAIVADGINP
jgi:hypothetical protein